MTFDGASAIFYINGVASVTVPSAQMLSYGLLSELQVYNRALTPAEIQGIYAP